MLEIKIITIGKCKENWIFDGIKEYEKRLKPFLKIQWLLAKNEKDFSHLLNKETVYFCLDEKGLSFQSPEFSQTLMKLFEENGSKLTFVIGPAAGIHPDFLKKSKRIFSLSPMTFTHQMARLIFIEQVYRSLEIYQNKKYQK